MGMNFSVACRLPPVCWVALLDLAFPRLPQNAGVGPQLPHWVLGMLLRKMWLANNALTSLPPVKPPKVTKNDIVHSPQRCTQWLAAWSRSNKASTHNTMKQLLV
jgi:hypothetical protein